MKKAKKDIMGLTEAGILGGAGVTAISAVGGETGGVGRMMGMMPAVGTVMGAGMLGRSLSSLKPKRNRRRRRR